MQSFLKSAYNDKFVFIEDLNTFEHPEVFKDKELCIVKTDFKNINDIKRLCRNYPDLEIWLSTEETSRKNILIANKCGFKNVIPYPLDSKIVNDYLVSKTDSSKTDTPAYNIEEIKGLKVMVVDDNQMNIEILVETLRPFSLSISSFKNSLEASKYIEEEKFDLFLLDIMMPGFSGFDLAEIIKKSKYNANTPVIFISAFSNEEMKVEGYNLGSAAYIEKPFNVNIIRSQIYNILKNKVILNAIADEKESAFALITHDLKSPVFASLNAIKLLLNPELSKLDTFQKEIMEDLFSSGMYLKNLIENTLNKYKQNHGKIILQKRLYSLKDLINETITQTKYLSKDKHQKIVFKCKTKNSDVMIDCIEIKRVLNNLMHNAYEYAPKNSLITVELNENETNIIFSIENIGVGINMENPNEIFEKYVTYAKQYARMGSGLGLHVSKAIIEAHNGTISVESTPNKSTIFTFTLPKSE